MKALNRCIVSLLGAMPNNELPKNVDQDSVRGKSWGVEVERKRSRWGGSERGVGEGEISSLNS